MAKPISLTDAPALDLARYLQHTLGLPSPKDYTAAAPLMQAARAVVVSADEVLEHERARRRAM